MLMTPTTCARCMLPFVSATRMRMRPYFTQATAFRRAVFLFVLFAAILCCWGLGSFDANSWSTSNPLEVTAPLRPHSSALEGITQGFSEAWPIDASRTVECNSNQSQTQLALWRKQVRRWGYRNSSCPSDMWLRTLRDLDFSDDKNPVTQRVFINVGANKGYLAATALGLWHPTSGISPGTLFDFYNKEKPRAHCGICRDCKSTIVPPMRIPGRTPSLLVYAVEPTPATVALLHEFQAWVEGHNLDAVVIVPGAFSNASGWVMAKPVGAGNEQFNIRPNVNGTANITISTVDLFVADNIAASNNVIIDFLHIDAEGFDPAVLWGARKTLPFTRIVAFEYHGVNVWRQTSLQVEITALDRMGFDCYLEWGDLLVRLTGCWDRAFEFKQWSNVLCVNRRDAVWSATVRGLAVWLQ